MNFWLRVNLFLRSFFLQAGWNFAKYQNLGFAFVMLPFLRKLYRNDPEALPTVMQRYLDTFNTQPVMASFCFGALAKKEEDIAKKQTITEYKEQVMEWNGIRRGLSITAASIGDRLFWGTLKPLTLLLAVFIWMLLGINFFETRVLQSMPPFAVYIAGLTAFIVYNAIAWFVRWKGIQIGYQSDESSCYGLTYFDWNRAIYRLKRIGFLFSAFLVVFGVYRYFSQMNFRQNYFISRAVLVLFFVILSFVTRRLRIPNVYLYLASVVVFSVVCLF